MTIDALARTFSLILVTCLLASCVQSAVGRAPEKYLLPAGYVGSFHIVFGIKSGEPQPYDGDAREYRIPEGGLLLIQSDSNPGRIASNQIRFFYQGAGDKIVPIENRWTTSLHDTPENRADDRTYVFGGGISQIEPVRNCRVFAKSFYVGTKSEALDKQNHFDIYSQQGIESLPESVFLESCQDT